jgi:hypothetical protein
VPEQIEKPKRVFRRAARGRDPATPAFVIGGVTLVIAIAVAALAALAFLLYFLV